MGRISGRSRAIIIATSALTVLVFLPFLFGKAVLSRAQDVAARHFPGKLEADSCSLGWFGGLHCQQVRYRDDERGFRFEAPKLSSDKGLLLLLISPSHLGDIVVEQPALTVFSPLPDPNISSSAGDEQRQVQAPSWWERLTLRFKITGGQAVIDHGDASPRQIARQFEFDGNLAMGEIRYHLSFLSPQQSGQLRATGFINLPSAGQALPEMLIADAEVTIADLEISDFLQLAASRSQIPSGRGILNATVRLHAAGTREFEMGGETTLRNVQLSGGILGADHPELEALDFRFSGSYSQEAGWRLGTLELLSAPVHLSAKGGFNAGAGNLSATGRIDVPFLAAQIPRLLKIREQTTITEGAVDFSLAASSSGQVLSVRTNCRTEHLSLNHGGRPYSWKFPLLFAIDGDYGADRTAVRSLRVQTPFFEAQGGGSPDGFFLRGSGDLDRMSQELNTMFNFDVQAKGRIEVSATTKKTAGETIDCEGRIGIRDFTWIRGKKAPPPPHDVLISGRAVAFPSVFQDGALDSLQIEASAWPGNFSLRAGDMRQNEKNAKDNCTLQGNVDLARLSDVIQGLRDAPLFPALQGTLRFDGNGSCATATKMTLHTLRGMVEELAVIGPGYAIREPKASFALGGTGQFPSRQVGIRELAMVENQHDLELEPPLKPFFQVDGVGRQLAVQRLEWASSGTNLTVGGTIKDWRRPAAGFSASLKGETQAALLGDLAKGGGWLPMDVNLEGTARGSLAIDADTRGGMSVEASLDITSFSLMSDRKKLFADPHLIVRFVLDKDERAGASTSIPSLLLRSALLNIDGAGSIAATTVPPMLEMQGQMTCDYAALLPMLSPLAGQDISMSGNQTTDIVLSLPLQWPVPMERLTFSAQLPVDAFSLQGIAFKPLVVPVDCNRGRLRCRLDGQLEGGGRVTLEPVVHFAGPQTTLSLPPGDQMMQDAALKPALTRLLGRLHPLFGPMAQPQGMINMRPSAFSLQSSGKEAQWPEFAVTLVMNRAKFKPTGALRELLTLAGFAQEWLLCKEAEMVCEGKKGRVHCGLLRLQAGDHEIGFQGEMLPDGSLRYLVRLPLSRQLMEKAQLTTQGKMTVEAEIRGDREQPAFDAAAFLAGLPKQTRQKDEAKQAGSGQPADSAGKDAPQADAQKADAQKAGAKQ